MMPTSSPIPNSETNTQSALSEEMVVLHLIATGIVRRATNIERGQRANGNYEIPLQLGLDRLNVLRYRQAQALIKSVPDLLVHCQQPIGEWLPGDLTIFDPDEQLLGGPFPTEICQNLACMTGDVEADLSESRFIERVFNACKEASSPQAYTDFRRLLITKPVMTSLELLLCYDLYPSLTILRELLHEAYEPAPLDYMVDGIFNCCPTCKNLQLPNYEQTHFVCESERCRRQPAKAGEGRRVSASDQIHWLKRGLRRFVAQPGLPELRLEKSLSDMDIPVEMWPEFDSYDLLVRLQGRIVAVDVKDWANPFLLARKIQEKGISSVPKWDEAYYIFPTERKRDQPDYVRAFTNTCNTLNGRIKIGGKVKAAFENDFISMVRNVLKENK